MREEKGNVGYTGVAGGKGQGWFCARTHAAPERYTGAVLFLKEGKTNLPQVMREDE